MDELLSLRNVQQIDSNAQFGSGADKSNAATTRKADFDDFKVMLQGNHEELVNLIEVNHNEVIEKNKISHLMLADVVLQIKKSNRLLEEQNKLLVKYLQESNKIKSKK